MKNLLLSVLFVLSAACLFGQSEFSVIKTDDSNYPLIDLWIRADSGTVSEKKIKVFSEDNSELSYNLEKISGFKHDKESAVLLLVFEGCSEPDNDSVKQELISFLTETQKSFKLNIAYVSQQDGQMKLNFLSPEFTQNYEFFSARLKDFQLESDTVSEAGQAVHEAIKEIADGKSKVMNFSVFLIGNRYRAAADQGMIHGLIQSDIHIYGLLRDSVNAENEKQLISLCSRTGGIYTKSEYVNFDKVIHQYAEDALLYASVTGFEFFKVQFETPSKAQKSYGIISNGEKELSFTVYRKRLLGKIEIYQLLLLLMSVILFYFILMFFVHRRRIYYLKLKTGRSETIPASDKHVVLNIQSSGLSKRIVLEDKRYSVGRHESNDIVIDSDTVSAFHAEIIKEGGLYSIMDKGSTNGILSGGKRIVKEKLRRSMQLKLGDVYIKVSYE